MNSRKGAADHRDQDGSPMNAGCTSAQTLRATPIGYPILVAILCAAPLPEFILRVVLVVVFILASSSSLTAVALDVPRPPTPPPRCVFVWFVPQAVYPPARALIVSQRPPSPSTSFHPPLTSIQPSSNSGGGRRGSSAPTW
eukprot:9503935-Pyramimonas_sp.AAC.3